MKPTVAAVVVTYNRKDLLTRCLTTLLGQSRPVDRIFVIDNASTDGTEEHLRSHHYLDHPTVEYVRLNHNGGGAGGFHAGMQRAFAAGYDWLWLMDDDGYAAPDCLEHQLKAQDALDIIGVKVVQTDDPSQLTWTLIRYDQNGYFSPRQRIHTFDELARHAEDNIYVGYGIFFNAIMIHRRVVEQIGLVNPQFVIRGDEFEYFLRSRQAGFKIGTQIQATYYHPLQPFQANEWKFFYTFRNLFYNYTQYASVTYPQPILSIYLAYNFAKYLAKSPSFNWRYLAHVLNALRLATQGKLLSYRYGPGPRPSTVAPNR
jgi:rhamnopyranosyl-N-acetylglucosaminyl-diphospho-decaprenol beta-1,3/1,4-galactofuranosyltransferase